MTSVRLAFDPFWQCLCPSWTTTPFARTAISVSNAARPQLTFRPKAITPSTHSVAFSWSANNSAKNSPAVDFVQHPLYNTPPPRFADLSKREQRKQQWRMRGRTPPPPSPPPPEIEYHKETNGSLYAYLRSTALDGKTKDCRAIVEILIRDRRERPSVEMYNALILSNASHDGGTAWRAAELVDEMRAAGLEMDNATCHAVLRVLSVHPDHLWRAEVLDIMGTKWYHLSDDGMHDVAAGMFREGLFEQGLQRLEIMRGEGVRIQGWLLDMAVYTLCEADEVDEAFLIMRSRHETHEIGLSRSLWWVLLDKASEARHYSATQLVWTSQVNQKYLNPSAGICLNVLATAAAAGDAIIATEVFSLLNQRGGHFQPVHYELLMNTYLTREPPDLRRALSVLSLMASEKFEPTPAETRTLFAMLKRNPTLIDEVFSILRSLHEQGRPVPLAALNLLIESHVEQHDLTSAMKIYKLIHTFVPLAEGQRKSFANVETFNLLFKACRLSNPPDAAQASFLVSELLALRIRPSPLTYDRLILVFAGAAIHALSSSSASSDPTSTSPPSNPTTSPDVPSNPSDASSHSLEFFEVAFRHFSDMTRAPRCWMPRFGTLSRLAVGLARIGDERCWIVLQAAEDAAGKTYLREWDVKGKYMRRDVEEGWREAVRNGLAMEREEDVVSGNPEGPGERLSGVGGR